MKFLSRIIIVVLTVVIFGSFLISQEKVHWDVVSKIREEGFERSKIVEYVEYMSDVIGPRLTGSPNIREAQAWTKGKMEEIGLENSVIEPWGDHCVGWEIERISIHLLEPDYQVVFGYPYAFTPGTDGIITGQPIIVLVNSQDDLEQYRGKLNNAIVLTTTPMQVSPRFSPDAFRHTEESLSTYAQEGVDVLYQRYSNGQPGQQSFRPGVSEAELEAFLKSENVGVVLKASTGSDGTIFASGRPTSRNDRSIEGVRNSVPMIAVAAEHYNRIYRVTERGIPVKMEVEIRVKLDDADTRGYNVIGEIKGADPALRDEIVMIGGHLDSWHTGTGASDNAGGISVALEAMRILKTIGAEPRRTIRIGLWSNEEGGLKGSRGYVKNHFGNPRDGNKPEYENFSVYFNMDNGTGQFRGVHLQGNSLAAPIFEAWMKPFNDLRMETLSQYSNNGTDHVAFDESGLPGFQFLQDRIDYRSRTWHGNMDVFDHVLPEDLKINAVIMASFAYHAAMRDELFPRKPFTNYRPDFEPVQPELFKDSGALSNTWGDFDNDGDLDLFIGFNGQGNRLYRNDDGKFTDIAGRVGLADKIVTRSAAWCDYDGDGNLDLYLGFIPRSSQKNRLYKNEGNGKKFTDVASSVGVDLSGNSRQVTWVDFDSDGDVDLYMAFRDKPNALLRNDGSSFSDVAKSMGVDDPRRTVGAAWFDYDKDGDLDLYVTNMDGDANGMFRNDGSRFVDVAEELGLDNGGRPLGKTTFGSVRPTIGDFDYDGDLDIFTANYGPNGLFSLDENGKYVNVAPKLGLAIDDCYDAGTWGDFDNNGRLDLYVNGTVTRGKSYRDYLFLNDDNGFTDITPRNLLNLHADHGVHWVDFDLDGDLDLSLTGSSADGMHYLVRNDLSPEKAQQSLQVLVLNENGCYTRAGAEVRVFKQGSKELLGCSLLDTGSGYNSQNAMPVHFGLRDVNTVDVEITSMTQQGRIAIIISNVNIADYFGGYMIVKVDGNGNQVK
ncbi:M20/M25/M40 family metallo-hydrolase [candidate division KSB1 bacterium]